MGWGITGRWMLGGMCLVAACDPAQGSQASSRPPVASRTEASTASASDAGSDAEGGTNSGDGCLWQIDERAVEPISPRSDRSYALSGLGNQLELVWTRSGCGLPGREMRRLSLPTEGPGVLQEPLGDATCQWRKHPTLLHYAAPSSDDGYALDVFYAASVENGFVPMRQPLQPAAEPREVTAVQGDYWDARGLSAILLHGQPLLAWVGAAPGETEDTGRAVYVQRVRVEATPQTLVQGDEGQRPGEVTLAAMGGDSDAGAAVAWASHSGGSTGGIFLAALDADGAVSSGVQRLLAAGGSAAEVAVTGHPDGGGALAYVVDADDEGAHVRLQRLDSQGRVDGRAHRITPGSLYAHDVSLAPFGTGFVLGYRLVSTHDEVEPRIQLAFTDASGNLVGNLDVAPAQPSGGPTSVATTLDGSLVVAWVDITDEGALLHVWGGSCQ